MPSSINRLENHCFEDCDLKSIELSDSLEEIGESCFYGCTGLIIEKWPENLKKIEKRAFYNTGKSSFPEIPDYVEVGDNVFGNPHL